MMQPDMKAAFAKAEENDPTKFEREPFSTSCVD
jgi:hypothetical protein